MDKIERVRADLLAKASELAILLEPFEKEIGEICTKPLKEMCISEKIKLANLLIAARRKTQ